MTEAVKHTSGPWRVFNGTDVFPDDDDTKGTRHIADCSMTGSQFISGEEKRANALLIAAAPELIDVVREMIPFLEEIARQRHPAWRPEMADRDSVLGRAYSAIAKAEGRS